MTPASRASPFPFKAAFICQKLFSDSTISKLGWIPLPHYRYHFLLTHSVIISNTHTHAGLPNYYILTFQVASKQCWQEEVKFTHLHEKEMFDTLNANCVICLRNMPASCDPDDMQIESTGRTFFLFSQLSETKTNTVAKCL